jgi:hypothetical protein
MLMALPSPLTVYTTVSGVPGSVVSVVVGGIAAVVLGGVERVVLGALVVVVVGAELALGSGIGGSGATTVSSLDDPLAITNAITRPTTNSTARPATIQSQRGDFGGPGGGSSPGGVPWGGYWVVCVQYGGRASVGLGVAGGT